MGSKKLKADLNNCLINFDRKVLMTQLLDDYKLSHNEVDTIVGDFVKDQEKKQNLKYEKLYVVHGNLQKEDRQQKEIYKIVEEAKLKEWLKKLNNAQSSLYAVEVAGGAKAPASIFKSMSVEADVKTKQRAGTKAANGTAEKPETSKAPAEKKEIKQEVKKSQATSTTSKPTSSESIKTEKKSSPKTETSPAESKKTTTPKAAAVKKGGINNFFTAGAKKSEDSKDTKSSSGTKPPTPKKMQDFFKKQAEKPKTATESLKKPAANTSVQLFDDEEEEEPEAVSSDEEENLEAIKRDIISSDIEMGNDDDEEAKPSTTKRRRIIDSDDDDEDEKPAVKHEKRDAKEEVVEVADEVTVEQLSETYLDEDGFVITKKPKQKAQPLKKKSPTSAVTSKKSPTKKTSPQDSKKISPKAAKAAAAANKTKQPNIMNFFTKK